MLETAVGHIGDMKEPIDTTEVDERPVSVIFLTAPTTIAPHAAAKRSLRGSRARSRRTRRDKTMLPRFLLNLMILNSSFSPISAEVLTGQRSTWEPGKKAFTPILTDRPPLTRAITVPVTVSSRSTGQISSQAFMRSAFSFERLRTPSLFSIESK